MEAKEPMQQLDRQTYAEMLAPYDTNEDFSTSSMMRDKGNNLTTEKLLKLQPEQIVEQVLAKAGVINFSRVIGMVQDICSLKKIPHPDESQVLKMLLSKSYVAVDSQLFIAKSELCYSRDKTRQIAIRDFVLDCLCKAKEPVPISTLIEATKSNFKELTPILDNVG